jgi:GNAT superfamily N-acetyltransferase
MGSVPLYRRFEKGEDMETIPLPSRMDMLGQIYEVNTSAFPPFIVANPSEHTERCLAEFAAYQMVMVEDDVLVASGLSVPVCWEPGKAMPPGWYEVIGQAVEENERRLTPTALCALSIGIRSSQQGRGIGARMIRAMKDVARDHGLAHMIAPVRPTLKAQYPLIPMAEYMNWRRSDGSLFDPWLRVHSREGARQIGVAPDAMVIGGTVSEWELWSSLQMKSSGSYVVPGALSPVEVDIHKDSGVYREDNVWVYYDLTEQASP